MSILNSLKVTGRLGNVVYQRTFAGGGNVPEDPTRRLQVHAYRPHNLSHSPAQLACRAKFRDSMTAWHALSYDQQKDFNRCASKKAISGMNMFLSIKLRS
jgi:hypothetical protein